MVCFIVVLFPVICFVFGIYNFGDAWCVCLITLVWLRLLWVLVVGVLGFFAWWVFGLGDLGFTPDL